LLIAELVELIVFTDIILDDDALDDIILDDDILDDIILDDGILDDIILDDDILDTIILDDDILDIILDDDILDIILDDDILDIILDEIILVVDEMDEEVDGIDVEVIVTELLMPIVALLLILLLLILLVVGKGELVVVVEVTIEAVVTHKPPLLVYPTLQLSHACPLYGSVQLHPTPLMPSSQGTTPLQLPLDVVGQAINEGTIHHMTKY